MQISFQDRYLVVWHKVIIMKIIVLLAVSETNLFYHCSQASIKQDTVFVRAKVTASKFSPSQVHSHKPVRQGKLNICYLVWHKSVVMHLIRTEFICSNLCPLTAEPGFAQSHIIYKYYKNDFVFGLHFKFISLDLCCFWLENTVFCSSLTDQ